MVFSFLYVVLRALFGGLVRSRRGLSVNEVELLLRHELEIVGRQVARPKLGTADRALLAAAACQLPRSSRGALLVTPRTLFAMAAGAGASEVATAGWLPRATAAIGRDPGARDPIRARKPRLGPPSSLW